MPTRVNGGKPLAFHYMKIPDRAKFTFKRCIVAWAFNILLQLISQAIATSLANPLTNPNNYTIVFKIVQ
jgi:hypothetical protein